MAYFVTGATGFIGRFLVEQLLKRDGDIHVLVREGSQDKLDDLRERWDDGGRVKPVIGDLTKPKLGVDEAWIAEHRGKIDHFFHLAAIYDMTVADERNEELNVGGTRNAVALANDLQAGILHHTSSVAAAGNYKGLFREDHFDEGQELPSAYHRTKFESEKIAREESQVPWRVYRPAIVIGHSQTGEMDKIDGPYYFFKAIQKLRHWLPEWVPLAGPGAGLDEHRAGRLRRARDGPHRPPARAGRPGLPPLLARARSARARCSTPSPRPRHAPQLAIRVDKRITDALPKGVFGTLHAAAPDPRGAPPAARRLRHPRGGRRARRARAAVRHPRHGAGAGGHGHRGPAARVLRRRRSGTTGSATSTRTCSRTGRSRPRSTGAPSSSRAPRAASAAPRRSRSPAAGGIPLLVARSLDKLEETKAEIEAEGGTAYVYSADLSDTDSIDELVARMLNDHVAIDMLVNNAGRSIRRSVSLSLDRFHDYERTMQLNYFGTIKLVMGLMPHMKQRHFGHVVNVSSIGVQTNPPRFSAYVASKAALDAFTRVVSSEVLGDGITFTTIHMPLVRTPMIAPDEDVRLVPHDHARTRPPTSSARRLRSKPKQINTRLGTFGEVAYTLAPKAVDQILHMAYKVFPDSAAAKGQKDPNERASMEQVAMANLMKGVHW